MKIDTLNLNFSLLLKNVKMDIRFDYFNASQNIKPSSFSFHSHTVYEVYFIENGEMSVCLSDHELELKAQDILFIAPNTMHRVKKCAETLKRFNVRFLLDTQSAFASVVPYFLYSSTDEIKAEIFQNIEKIYMHMPNIGHPWEFFRIRSYFSVIASYIVESLLPANEETVKDSASTTYAKPKIDQYIQLD